jgi:hypothetical protein
MLPTHSQAITVGNRIVGSVSIDDGAIRGEGGPIRPQLVVPLAIQLSPTPEDAQLALCVRAALEGRERSSARSCLSGSR